jgi:hypothetical protein
MSDLIGRLRISAHPDCGLAADEIDRLTAEVERLLRCMSWLRLSDLDWEDQQWVEKLLEQRGGK